MPTGWIRDKSPRYEMAPAESIGGRSFEGGRIYFEMYQ